MWWVSLLSAQRSARFGIENNENRTGSHSEEDTLEVVVHRSPEAVEAHSFLEVEVRRSLVVVGGNHAVVPAQERTTWW